MKPKPLILTAVFAALTCVLAPISVTIASAVPVTLATFAVMLSGLLLGGRLGALCQLIYLLIGVIGLPVCAGWTPALPRILGPTGGYLIGYIPMAFLCGAIYFRCGREAVGIRKIIALIVSMLAATVALYSFGTAWFCILNRVGVLEALTVCVLPFLIGDAVKIAAAAILVPRLEHILRMTPASPHTTES
jgi:biotin transport system substrate-specific component